MARHLITSALPYINGVKHLGNLVGSMLPADVYARFLRRQGHEVLFICATDEHGTPAELAAREAGVDVQAFCDEQHEIQKRIYDEFELSFDHFGRTSRPPNHELTQHFAAALDDKGLLEVRQMQQVYSPDDGRFLPDRYIIGTCPNCGYPMARGDQCENCAKQLDPTDLIEPRSAISGSTNLEIKETAHLFFLQSRLQEEIRAWVDSHDRWPAVVAGIARKWLDEGLQDRGITRDLTWGVPVDPARFPELAGKVFYVWFDAPIGYLGATVEWGEAGAGRDWEAWWRTDKGAADVTYTQFMGKDNVPFHTVGFPGTIIGSAEPWKLADDIKGFNWMNYYGGKFSTSQHRGVFMDDALRILPADYWRWFLIANAPESDDATFTWELFATSVNKELVGLLGNYVHRTLTLVSRNVPDGFGPQPAVDADGELAGLVREYYEAMAALQFRKVALALRAIWAHGNKHLERTEPWRTVKTDRDAAVAALWEALVIAGVIAECSEPILPDAAAKIRGFLGTDAADLVLDDGLVAAVEGALDPARPYAPGDFLFRKLEDEEIEAWEEEFSGA